jgi:hypothetical protein
MTGRDNVAAEGGETACFGRSPPRHTVEGQVEHAHHCTCGEEAGLSIEPPDRSVSILRSGGTSNLLIN